MSFIRQHKGAVLWSVVLHLTVLVGAMIAIPWPERARVAVPTAPIQGVIIDTAAIERDQARRDEAARQVRQQQQRQERERVAAAEQQRLTEQREKQRVADAERTRVAAEQERREQAQRDQERKEQQAREQREKEAAAQRERDRQAAEQRRREAELQAALAAEAERADAEAAGLLDQYMRMLESRIKQHWDRPLSARTGIDCVVNVVQLQTGDVMSAVVGACNGDDAVRRSIERAVMEASPLPKAPHPSLFDRNLEVNFRPDE